jgi:threonine dehydrogenase-like Zn-dependent dehydrogenase
MRALIFDGNLRFENNLALPSRSDGEALVRVRMAGICGTDVEITHGYKGFTGVLGHEFVGEVVESNDVSWIGQRVCGEVNVACGSCRYCIERRPTHCSKRSVLGILGRDGCFADYLVIPERNLHRVPGSISDEEATMVEPLAAAFQITEQVDLSSVHSVVVLGDGRLGSLCALTLKASGCDPLVVGKHGQKLKLLERLGVRTQMLADEKPRDIDLVVEATGSTSGVSFALEWTRPLGIVVLKSTVASSISTDLSLAVVKELTLVGSRCGPFGRAIRALEEREVDVKPLITDCFKLEDGCRAFQRAQEKDAIKVLLAIS